MGRRIPYLVIDPTRGQEFRWLLNAAPVDLLIFTVGDSRGVPFCFNPFIVPPNVSLLVHISRLMSPFRAAYYMWDPLPAIFESAIRLAYQRKFEQLGKPWNPVTEIGTGRAEDYPNLSDVCEAMGTGDPDETGTVLSDQRRRWSADGQGTENQATIITSTSIRLKNLQDNYDHVIGGPAADRPCVDLGKLLSVPAILELGMIGDSQALSLVMGFLVVSLVGYIESRDVTRNPLHCLVIEEAHRLLSAEISAAHEGASSRAQAAEYFNNLLAEIRKHGEGVILMDQRPGSLVGGAIDKNAYFVAQHRLNERASFDQFADMNNLGPRHRRFARVALEPGEAIILDRPSGMPVLIRPPEIDKKDGHQDDRWLAEHCKDRVKAVHYEWTASRHPMLDRIMHRPEAREHLARLKDLLADRLSPTPVSKLSRLANELALVLGLPKASRQSTSIQIVKEIATVNGYSADQIDRLVAELTDSRGEIG